MLRLAQRRDLPFHMSCAEAATTLQQHKCFDFNNAGAEARLGEIIFGGEVRTAGGRCGVNCHLVRDCGWFFLTGKLTLYVSEGACLISLFKFVWAIILYLYKLYLYDLVQWRVMWTSMPLWKTAGATAHQVKQKGSEPGGGAVYPTGESI